MIEKCPTKSLFSRNDVAAAILYRFQQCFSLMWLSLKCAILETAFYSTIKFFFVFFYSLILCFCLFFSNVATSGIFNTPSPPHISDMTWQGKKKEKKSPFEFAVHC